MLDLSAMAQSDAQSHVEQLIAQCKQGKSPQTFSDFLERTCPPSPQGWFATLLFGTSARTVDIYDIQAYQEDPFRQSCLFWAWATGVQLEQTILPGRTRLGLFAYGPGGYHYLSRRRATLEQILDNEGRPLDDFDPSLIAKVFLDVLANQGPYTHALIRSHLTLDTLSKAGFDPREYRLDEQEWKRWNHLITAPYCVGDEQHGWSLELFTFYGWMHDKRTLCRIRYRIHCKPGSYRERPTNFRIAEQIEPLSSKIFRDIPILGY